MSDNEAVYWDAMQRDRLDHETLEEAVLEYVESYSPDGAKALKEWIEDLDDIEVNGYSRTDFTGTNYAQNEAFEASERFVQSIEEEFGDPEGEMESFSPEVLTELRKDLEAAYAKALSKAITWRCEQTTVKKVPSEEVLQIVKEWNPEWLEEDGEDDKPADTNDVCTDCGTPGPHLCPASVLPLEES